MKHTLSEDATIELNGVLVDLPSGTSLIIEENKNLFKVDYDFEVWTNKGCVLVESNDVIRLVEDGEFTVDNSAKFVSSDNVYMLDKGDSFNIVEGFWSAFKQEMGWGDKVGQQLYSGLTDLVEEITDAAEVEASENNGVSSYESLFRSKEWATLANFYKYAQKYRGRPDRFERALRVLNVPDLPDIIARIRDELMNIGAEPIARVAEKLLPQGLLAKAARVWRKGTGQNLSNQNLTRASIVVGQDNKGRKFRIVDGNLRKAYPLDPQHGKEVWIEKEKGSGVFRNGSNKIQITIQAESKPESDSIDSRAAKVFNKQAVGQTGQTPNIAKNRKQRRAEARSKKATQPKASGVQAQPQPKAPRQAQPKQTKKNVRNRKKKYASG